MEGIITVYPFLNISYRVHREIMMKNLINIAILGAIGGFIGVLFNLWLGNPSRFNIPLDLLVASLLGAGASLIFVFLIANTDRSDTARLLTLALLGGFAWQPVWEGSLNAVNKSVEQNNVIQAEDAIKDAQKTASKIPIANTGKQSALAKEVNTKIEQAYSSIQKIDSLETRMELKEATDDLTEKINGLPPEAIADSKIQENAQRLAQQVAPGSSDFSSLQ
ncbi:MAG: hypothetical protein F6K47_22455 [Symploca sp. SIO2E6]|nr:hypothetical protein [Symploca sp. SIO2E6]